MKDGEEMMLKYLLVCCLNVSSVFAQDLILPKGGMSGGGGGTLEGPKVGEVAVTEILNDARAVLVSYFYFKQATPHREDLQPYPGVAQVMDTIIPKILSVGIEKARSKPCFDADQVEKDGSIYSDASGTICISSFNLGVKLTKEALYSQTLALVAHEYAHLVGADEVLATKIQEEIASDLSGSSFSEFNRQTNEGAAQGLWMRFRGGDEWKIRGSESNYYFMSGLSEDLINYYGYAYEYGISGDRYPLNHLYSMFPLDAARKYQYAFLEFRILVEELMDPSSYAGIFGDRDQVSASWAEYFLEHYSKVPSAPLPDANDAFMISKITDQASYERELLRVRDLLHELSPAMIEFRELTETLHGK